MLYRDMHHAADRMDRVLAPLRRALLADSSQEMTERAQHAEAAAEQMLRRLQTALRDSADTLEVESSDGKAD